MCGKIERKVTNLWHSQCKGRTYLSYWRVSWVWKFRNIYLHHHFYLFNQCTLDERYSFLLLDVVAIFCTLHWLAVCTLLFVFFFFYLTMSEINNWYIRKDSFYNLILQMWQTLKECQWACNNFSLCAFASQEVLYILTQPIISICNNKLRFVIYRDGI